MSEPAGSVVLTLRLRRVLVQPAALVLPGLGLLCALGLALRDGALMTRLDILGLFAALSIGTASLRFPWAKLKRFQAVGHRFQSAQTRRVLTELPLLVFGWLLGGADARFGELVSRLFQREPPNWNLNALTFALFQLRF